jgi:hypothetical protein
VGMYGLRQGMVCKQSSATVLTGTTLAPGGFSGAVLCRGRPPLGARQRNSSSSQMHATQAGVSAQPLDHLLNIAVTYWGRRITLRSPCHREDHCWKAESFKVSDASLNVHVKLCVVFK